MTIYPKMIVDALATVTYAGTKKNLIESEMLVEQPVCRRLSDQGQGTKGW